MTEFLVRRFVRRYEHTEDPAVRTAYGNLAGAVGIACNALRRHNYGVAARSGGEGAAAAAAYTCLLYTSRCV